MIDIETGTDWERFFKDMDLEKSVKRRGPYASIHLDYEDIMMKEPDLAQDMIDYPDKVMDQGGMVLCRMLEEIHGDIFQSPFIRVFNLPSTSSISELNASDIGRLVQLRGVINVRTPPNQRVQVSCDKCTSCGFEVLTYAHDGRIEGPYQCPKDEGGCGKNLNQTRFVQQPEKTVWMDYMELEIEDIHDMELVGSPEKLRGILEGEIVTDLRKRPEAGERVTVSAIYKQRSRGSQNGVRKDRGEPYLHIIHMDNTEKEDLRVTSTDIELFEDKAPEALGMVKESIAPTIHGFDSVRTGLALALFGGVSGEQIDGGYQRGEIHVHLIGDPGTGKSRLVAGAMRLAPRGKRASGKSTSGVGLVGAVVKDQFSGDQYTLRAGVLAKADRGHAWVDEVDKLCEEDRDNLREAMESGEVPINKGGISAVLKARTTVFLVSNPEEEEFDPTISFKDQNSLSSAIRSRIDLEYYVTKSEEERIMKSILKRMNRTRMRDESLSLAWDLHMIKKYIYHARTINPMWTEKAMGEMEGRGALQVWRCGNDPRKIEALYRLSEASARSRLSEEVKPQDVHLAVKVLDGATRTQNVPLVADEDEMVSVEVVA